ncbi:MAG: prenyltransferase [Deltaproteobacteria bacterium]|nr:prenyltransferase [Deltaproteobacteria bacterium]
MITSPTPLSPTRASLPTWLRAIRAPSLTATFMPSLATLLLGLALGWELRPALALLAVLGVLAVQIGVNLMNDVEDDARRIDAPGALGGSGVIQAGLVSAEAMRRVARAAFALGLALGLPALVAEPALLVVVALAALGAWGYSGGPGLKYRALGDVAVVTLCGPVLTVGFALAAFGAASLEVVALGLAFGFAALGILHVNNLQDMEVDARAGARTVALALGRSGARIYLVVVYALALVAWPVGALVAGLPAVAAILPALAAAPIGALVTRLWRAAAAPGGLADPRLALVRVDAAKAHLALGALVSLGLVLSSL